MSPTKIRIFAFLAYGLVLYGVSFLLVPGMSGGSFWTSLFVVPLCLGMFAQAVFDPGLKFRFRDIVKYSAALLGVLVLGLMIFGIEALMCVAMALPFIVPALLLGIYLARFLLQKLSERTGSTTLKASLILLPLLALPLDQQFSFPQASQTIRSEVIVDAPADVVWAQTLVIPEIQPDERVWTFSHNVLATPRPESATLNGNLRDLRWTKGVRFQEIITGQIENERLSWRFNFHDEASLASFDPHVSPNSEMLRVSDGFYELTQLSDGRTRLVLETHYQTRSPVNGYLRLWGKLFLNDFHNAVLGVIQMRAERQTHGRS